MGFNRHFDIIFNKIISCKRQTLSWRETEVTLIELQVEFLKINENEN